MRGAGVLLAVDAANASKRLQAQHPWGAFAAGHYKGVGTPHRQNDCILVLLGNKLLHSQHNDMLFMSLLTSSP